MCRTELFKANQSGTKMIDNIQDNVTRNNNYSTWNT